MSESSAQKTENRRPDSPAAAKADGTQLRAQLAAELEQAAAGGGSIAALENCVRQLEDAAGIPLEADTEAALAEFHEKHHAMMLEPEAGQAPRHKRKMPRLAVAVAAAVVLVTATFAGASDLGVVEIIAHWTGDTFHFAGSGFSSEPAAESPVPGEYETVVEALASCGIPEAAFPKWLPEEASLQSVTVREGKGRFLAVSADYVWEDSGESFFVELKKYARIGDAHAAQFEKDDTPVLEYEAGGTTHYLFGNPAGNVAVWNQDDLICMIVGDLTEDEFKKMIDSIYEE